MRRGAVSRAGWAAASGIAALGAFALLGAAREAGAGLLGASGGWWSAVAVVLLIVAAAAWRPGGALVGLALLTPLVNNATVRGGIGGGVVPTATLLALAVLAGGALRAAMSPVPDRPARPGDALVTRLLVVYVAFVAAMAVVAFLRTGQGWPFVGGGAGAAPGAASPLSFPINTYGETADGALLGIATASLLALAGPMLALLILWFCSPAGERSGAPPSSPARLLVAWNVALIPALLVGVGHLFAIVGGLEPHFAILRQYHATFTDPNALGAFVLLLAAPTLLSLSGSTTRLRLVLGAGCVASVALLVLSGSRTGTAGFLIAVAASWWVDRIRRRRLAEAAEGSRHQTFPRGLAARWVALPLLALLAIGGVLWWLTGGDTVGLLRRGVESGEIVRAGGAGGILRTDRLDNWSRALDVILTAPLAGIGPGLYWTELPNVFGWMPGWGGYRDNALNHYLQVAAELGLPGLALFLIVWGSIGSVLWRRLERSPLVAGTFVSWGVLTLAFMTGPHLLHPEPQLLWWMLAGMALAIARTGGSPEIVDDGNDRRRSPVLRGGVVLLAVALAAAGVAAAVVRATGGGSVRSVLGRHGLWQVGVMPSARDEAAGWADLWLAPEAELMLARGVTAHGSLMVGHPDAAERPVRVTIQIDDAPPLVVRLNAPFVEVPFALTPPAATDPGQRFAFVRVTTDRAWIPADTDPTSDDHRALGVLWRGFAAPPTDDTP